MYRVYWVNFYGNLDYIDVSILRTAKLIFYKLLTSTIFFNNIKQFGGIKLYLNKEWSEWIDKDKKTIRELFELNGEEKNFN